MTILPILGNLIAIYKFEFNERIVSNIISNLLLRIKAEKITIVTSISKRFL